MKSGEPVSRTDNTNKSIPVGYISAPPLVLYSAEYPERVRQQHEFEVDALKNPRHNAAIGLFSDADSSEGARLTKNMLNLQQDFIQGRKTLTEWRTGVETWRRDGGDRIRTELEAAFEAANN